MTLCTLHNLQIQGPHSDTAISSFFNQLCRLKLINNTTNGTSIRHLTAIKHDARQRLNFPSASRINRFIYLIKCRNGKFESQNQ